MFKIVSVAQVLSSAEKTAMAKSLRGAMNKSLFSGDQSDFDPWCSTYFPAYKEPGWTPSETDKLLINELLNMPSPKRLSALKLLVLGPKNKAGKVVRHPKFQLEVFKRLEKLGVDFKSLTVQNTIMDLKEDGEGRYSRTFYSRKVPFSDLMFLLYNIESKDKQYYSEMYLRSIPNAIQPVTGKEALDVEKTSFSLEDVAADYDPRLVGSSLLYSIRSDQGKITCMDTAEQLAEALKSTAYYCPVAAFPLSLSWDDMELLGIQPTCTEDGVWTIPMSQPVRSYELKVQFYKSWVEEYARRIDARELMPLIEYHGDTTYFPVASERKSYQELLQVVQGNLETSNAHLAACTGLAALGELEEMVPVGIFVSGSTFNGAYSNLCLIERAVSAHPDRRSHDAGIQVVFRDEVIVIQQGGSVIALRKDYFDDLLNFSV